MADQTTNVAAAVVDDDQVIIAAAMDQGPADKQKKFQLKAVDVGNIYKSLKLGQQVQTTKNSNMQNAGINMKLNKGVRNSSQANRTGMQQQTGITTAYASND